MRHLRRDQAPVSPHAWKIIDDRARAVLENNLAARKLVNIDGPHGWAHTAVDLGRTASLTESLGPGVQGRLRRVQPLLEVRVPFQLSRREIEDIERGAADPDLSAVVDAARQIARAEDRSVFYGCAEAGMRGMLSSTPHKPVPLTTDFEDFPSRVAGATGTLRDAGVAGPYAVALDPLAYATLESSTALSGYPILQHVQRLIDGPAIWAPALEGALVVSLRGGDFSLVIGEDLSIGYLDHDHDNVTMYMEESFTFRLLGPEAAVPFVLP